MRRNSIATLMVVVLISGAAVSALRDASETWSGVVLLMTLGLLTASILLVLNRRGVARAFWQGFAIFGWGYLVLTMAPWFVDQVQPRLPTSQLLSLLWNRLRP